MSELYQDNSDQLIQSLSYKSPNTASYIVERSNSSFQAIGSNAYGPTAGTKVIKFSLTSENFLDCNTLRVQFDIVHKGAGGTTLYPVSGPWCFFSRARLLIRGQVVDDITQYGRVHEMFSFLKSEGATNCDLSEAYLNGYHKSGTLSKELYGIPYGSKHTVLFKPLFCVLNQPKFLSLKYCPMTIELELDSDEYANVIKSDATSTYNGAWLYVSTATTSAFEIQNCVVRADIIRLDNELQNKYDDHLSSGGAITVKYTTYYSQILKSLGTSFNVNLSRSLTYLTRVFVSFIKATTADNAGNPADFGINKIHVFIIHYDH